MLFDDVIEARNRIADGIVSAPQDTIAVVLSWIPLTSPLVRIFSAPVHSRIADRSIVFWI